MNHDLIRNNTELLFQEKDVAMDKIIDDRRKDEADFLFGIFASFAMLALSLIMASGSGDIKCIGAFLFIGSSIGFLRTVNHYSKFKAEIVKIGERLHTKTFG